MKQSHIVITSFLALCMSTSFAQKNKAGTADQQLPATFVPKKETLQVKPTKKTTKKSMGVQTQTPALNFNSAPSGNTVPVVNAAPVKETPLSGK